MPDEMLESLHSLETSDEYNQKTSLIEKSFTDFKDEGGWKYVRRW